MSEMINRVAIAIAETTMKDGDNIRRHVDECYRLARAAIEAMREPTEEQYDALCAVGKLWRNYTSKEVWQTYIDAALK